MRAIHLLLFACALGFGTSTNLFDTLINENDWNKIFPERWGVGGLWKSVYPYLPIFYPEMEVDYYSYKNLRMAMDALSPISLKVNGSSSSIYVYRMDHRCANPEWKFMYLYGWTTSYLSKEVNLADFANKPGADPEDKLRELAAFLGNIAHETGEGTNGLFYREEIFFERVTPGQMPGHFYRDDSSTSFPPAPGRTDYVPQSPFAGQMRFPVKSYHGRGPLQLSWNYNYGQVSAILFGDIGYMLEHPGVVLEHGAYGFMTAIWFWMFPQPPKPSCHEVMYQDTNPNPPWGFGRSIMVINGGLESDATYNGPTEKDHKVTRRINNYKKAAAQFGVRVGIGGEQLDTRGMYPWG